MRIDFVEYLQRKSLFPTPDIEKNLQPTPHSSKRSIEYLSGYKLNVLVDLKPKTKTKITKILKSHLVAERKKAATGSLQYNSNRHISLLQALAELR